MSRNLRDGFRGGKLTGLALAAVCAFGLAACDGAETAPEPGQQNPEEVQQSQHGEPGSVAAGESDADGDDRDGGEDDPRLAERNDEDNAERPYQDPDGDPRLAERNDQDSPGRLDQSN